MGPRLSTTTATTMTTTTTMTRQEIEAQAHAAGYQQTPGLSENAPREIDDAHPEAWQWWAKAYRDGEADRCDDARAAHAAEAEAFALYGDA